MSNIPLRRDHAECFGLCSCGCNQPATIRDGFGQYATQQCRDDFYGPVAWQMPDDGRPASEIAESVGDKIAGAKNVVVGG